MKFQHFAAAVLDTGKETLLVAEHGNGNVRTDFHQGLSKPLPVQVLLPGIMDKFVPEACAVIVFVADVKVPPRDTAVERERIRTPFLLGGNYGHFIAVVGEPVRLVAKDFFHPGRTVKAGYVIDYAHIFDEMTLLSLLTANAKRIVSA